MNRISGLIICRDEENNIEDCIKSIQWCDEIVVIDSFSKDRTLEIVKKFTDKVFQNEWEGFSKQRKFALSKVNSEWIFSLDADERCTEELALEIRSILDSSNNVNGYLIPRKSFFLGKWIQHCGWYPDHQMRLFKRDKVTVSERLVHEGYNVTGETTKLKSDILHYTVRSVSEFAEKINHYSALSAVEKSDGKKISMSYLFFKPFFEFKKKFFFQQGFRDGIYGLMVSFFHMITKILTYMKMIEIQNKKDNRK
ncbi:MAG TPA: glycosyltransferase family 2 protein [Ignavibacteria bacterium]|nr:glycosyltransferase family 2 protein [Ignavibacteria bacterium]